MGIYFEKMHLSILFTNRLLAILWSCGLVASTYLDGDFDAQVGRLLRSEMLTQTEILNLSTVFHDLRETLQARWPGSEVFALGSFVTGLASKSSDADCIVTVPGENVTSARPLVIEAARLLQRHPQLYRQVRIKVHATRRIPLLKFIYVSTKRNCDVNFISNLALQNSRMMAYYFSLDNKFLSLAAVLKYWSKIQKLRKTDTIASNLLNLLIIFYLQRQNLAPPFILLQKHLSRCSSNDWNTNFSRKSYNTINKYSLYQLLGGFFKYYSKFNFDDYVISPLLGRPVNKSQFQDINSLPEELSLYKNYMRKPKSKPLLINTKLCVQDAIELNRNTADIPLEKADTFISHMKFAATMFEFLPKDDFLKVILTNYTNLYKKLQVKKNKRLKDYALVLVWWCARFGQSSHFAAQARAMVARESLGAEQTRLVTRGFRQLQDKLRTRWEGADLFIYGSYPAGLATKFSDVDLFLRIPNSNLSAEAYIVNETAKMLFKEPDNYSDIVVNIDTLIPMLTFFAKYMHRTVDLSFHFGAGVEAAKLFAYYLNLDKRYKKMALIIKVWFREHKLSGKGQKGMLPNYGICLLTIFYLQQKKMAPSGFELQANLPPRLLGIWNTNFDTIPYSIENKESLYELLGGFIQYYSEFDFKHFCISPYIGRPIAKSDLTEINRIPGELSTLKSYLNTSRHVPPKMYPGLCLSTTITLEA